MVREELGGEHQALQRRGLDRFHKAWLDKIARLARLTNFYETNPDLVPLLSRYLSTALIQAYDKGEANAEYEADMKQSF